MTETTTSAAKVIFMRESLKKIITLKIKKKSELKLK
jgi:hypothetical protein